MHRASTLSFVSFALALVATFAKAETTVPVAHVELIHNDGSVVGEYLVVDSFDPETGPRFTASLFESPDGDRLLEIDRLDRDEGLLIQRLEDLASGWWGELEQDFGFKNLGSPLDYADPMQWSLAIRDRERQERAPTTYTIRFSDGRQVRWVKPFGEAAEGEQNRQRALAELAASFAAETLPESAASALESLAALEATEGHPRLTAGKLFGFLWTAYSAAAGQPAEHPSQERSLSLRQAEGDSERMLKTIKHNTLHIRTAQADGPK